MLFSVLKFLMIVCQLVVAGCIVSTAETSTEGLHLKVAVAEQFAGISFIRDTNGTVVGYSGSMVALLQWLARRLKFSYTLVPTSFVLAPTANGTWNGAYGLLQRKQVDLVAISLPLDLEVLKFAEFTATVFEEPLVMMVPPPHENSRIGAVTEPFDAQVWLFFLGSAVFISIFSRLTFRLLQQQQKTGKRAKNYFTYDYITVNNLQLIFGQGGFEAPCYRPWRIRFTISGWILALIVFNYCYTSTFKSYASIPKLTHLVQTIEDLVYRTHLKPLAIQGRSTKYLFDTESTSETIRILGKRFLEDPSNSVKNPEEATELVASGCCVLIYPKYLLDFFQYTDYKKSGKCRISVNQVPVLSDHFAFALQKESPYTKIISRGILQAREMGLIDNWRKGSIAPETGCSRPVKPEVRPLTLVDLAGPFIIIICGLLISFAIFLVEKFVCNSEMPKKWIRSNVSA